MLEKETPSYRQDRWLAVVLWLVLFVLLLFASMGMIVPVNTINGLNFYASSANHRVVPIIFPISALVVLIIVSGIIINIWVKFFLFTRNLFITLAKSTDELSHNSLFYHFLTFSRPKFDIENNIITPLPDEAKGTIIGSILRQLALCYILLFVAILLVAVFPLYLR